MPLGRVPKKVFKKVNLWFTLGGGDFGKWGCSFIKKKKIVGSLIHFLLVLDRLNKINPNLIDFFVF